MHNIELNIEDLFLPEDVGEATKLVLWCNYCIVQLGKCLNTQDNKGALHWTLDHQRSVNDLKFLQFKKIELKRKMKNEKGN